MVHNSQPANLSPIFRILKKVASVVTAKGDSAVGLTTTIQHLFITLKSSVSIWTATTGKGSADRLPGMLARDARGSFEEEEYEERFCGRGND